MRVPRGGSGAWLRGLLLPYFLCATPRVTLADEPNRLTVTWQAPAECPTVDGLRSTVDRLLGSSADDLVKAPLTVDGTIAQIEPTRFRLMLRIEPWSRGGERWLVGSSCTELTNAAAIIVALSIDPDLAVQDTDGQAGSEGPAPVSAVEAPPPPSRPASASEKARPARPVAPRTADHGSPRSNPSIRFRSRALGTLAFGDLPRAALGGLAGAGLTLNDTSLWAYGGFLGWQDKRLDSYGGEFRVVAAAAQLCQAVAEGDFWVAPCGALELHWLRGAGLMVSTARSAQRGLLELGGGIEVGYEGSSRCALVAQGVLLVPQNSKPSRIAKQLAEGTRATPHHSPRIVGRRPWSPTTSTRLADCACPILSIDVVMEPTTSVARTYVRQPAPTIRVSWPGLPTCPAARMESRSARPIW